MKTICFSLCGLLVISCAYAAKDKNDSGWVSLFNGKDLKDWRIQGKQDDFKIKDGIIRCETGGGGQWMYYARKQFGDFVLRVEWRVSARGNSGIFLRAKTEGNPWETGYESQISNEQPPRDDAHCTGALYGYQAVNPRPDETPEKWRTTEITCKETMITVAIDGQKVCELDQDTNEKTKNKPLTGYVGVQDSHGPEGTWIEYQKVEIKELK